MKQVHIIAVLVIFSIVLLLFLSSFLPQNEATVGSGTGAETQQMKLLRLREQAVRDYVSHLEQEVMQIAIDKKNGVTTPRGGRVGGGSSSTGSLKLVHRDSLQQAAIRSENDGSNRDTNNKPMTGGGGVMMYEHDTGSSTTMVDANNQLVGESPPDSPHSTVETGWSKLFTGVLGQKDAIKAVSVAIDPDFHKWQKSLTRKLHCYMKANTNIAFYHYHVRKAAGTTIRDVVKMSLLHAKTLSMAKSSAQSYRLRSYQSKNFKLPTSIDGYYETEGLVLNPELLKQRDLFTITSLRDPITRILSLYWYEHVGWYEGVLRQGDRCKSMTAWVNYWRDSSDFKKEFHMKNPGNNYIEIENYYVKMLVGWKGGRSVTKTDLETAKAILRQFDMIFITEWMEDETQIDVMNALFTGRAQVTAGNKVQGNFRMKEKMRPILAPNEDKVKEELRQMNALDLELYDYAQSLMSFRLKHIIPVVEKVKKVIVEQQVVRVQAGESLKPGGDEEGLQCPVVLADVVTRKKDMASSKFKPSLGVFQPAGHKGP